MVGAGEQVTVVPRTWHRWWDASEDDLALRVRVGHVMRPVGGRA